MCPGLRLSGVWARSIAQALHPSGALQIMDDLVEEMRQCKSVQACIDLALTDAYGEDEQAVAWLTCIQEMFGRFKQVKVMGSDVVLVGFDLSDHAVVAV